NSTAAKAAETTVGKPASAARKPRLVAQSTSAAPPKVAQPIPAAPPAAVDPPKTARSAANEPAPSYLQSLACLFAIGTRFVASLCLCGVSSVWILGGRTENSQVAANKKEDSGRGANADQNGKDKKLQDGPGKKNPDNVGKIDPKTPKSPTVVKSIKIDKSV